MDSDQARAYVADKWPGAMQSPLTQAVQSFCVADEPERAIGFAKLQASASDGERKTTLADAMGHAEACLNGYYGRTVETRGHNVQSSFGINLDAEECVEIARQSRARRAGDVV